jgi:hypothetical protein
MERVLITAKKLREKKCVQNYSGQDPDPGV